MAKTESAGDQARESQQHGIRPGWIRTADGWDHTEPRMREILFWIKAGTPYKQIAERYGISMPRVSRIGRRAGYKPRPRGGTKKRQEPIRATFSS
jgi:DNA-binding NarL/FixJ family response regulator